MNGSSVRSNATSCALYIPFAHEVINVSLASWAKGLLMAFAFCSIVSVLVFVEEIVFLVRNIRKADRLRRTVWILSVFPMFTVTSFLALLIPRSGTLINLVANTFFASVIYQLVELLVDYLGGRDKMWIIIGESRPISIRTPPLCCCCLCLPDVALTRKTFEKFYKLVLQVTICRPLLMFIAAILWTDNLYIPGNMLPSNAFLYVSGANLVSTMLAIWGLMILKTGFRLELDKQFQITGKIACIQLTLFLTSVANIVCGILVTTNVIGCTSLLSSRARSDVLFHMVLVVLMSSLGIVARCFYRRASDGAVNALFDETLNINIVHAEGGTGTGKAGAEGKGGEGNGDSSSSSSGSFKDPNSNNIRTDDSRRINEVATVHENQSIS